VRLLPAFDTYLLGYAAREAAVRAEDQKRVFHGGEMAPVVLVDGCAEGTWHYERRGRQVLIQVTPFKSFDAEVQGLIRTPFGGHPDKGYDEQKNDSTETTVQP